MNSFARNVFGILAFALFTFSPPAHAQQAMHREVPRGEVTGLEMSIEGTLHYRAGEPFRWWVRLYEVVHRRDLRPAVHCTLRATAPFAASTPVVVPTGEDGRAVITIPVPAEDDAENTYEPLVVEATCPRGVRRVFDVALETAPAHRLVLTSDRAAFTPGAPLFVMGRLLDVGSGRGEADVPVLIQGASQGELRGSVEVRTDRGGFFTARFDMSASAHQVTFTAVATREDHVLTSTSLSLVAVEPVAATPMDVRVQAERAVVGPNEDVNFIVRVRTPEGTPIPGAAVRVPYADDQPPVRCDAHGVALMHWHSPSVLTEPLRDESVVFEVQSEAYGQLTAVGQVRVARQTTFAAVVPRGGALVPGLPARLYVRVVDASGAPRANEAVVVGGPAVGADRSAVTDAEGLAFVDVPSIAATEADACGGSTSTELTLESHGTLITRCVPVDLDAPLSIVTAPRVDASGEIAITLHRRAAAENETVSVTVLREGGEGWEPVTAVVIPSHARTGAVRVPQGVHGLLWVRARLLSATGEDIRGASAITLLEESVGSLGLQANDARITSSASAFVTLTSAARANTLRALLDPTFALRSLDTLALETTLANQVPADVGASAMLREGQIVPQALPDAPLSVGLLRDPWRTRARFVRGRVGRLMLAVENIVESSIPGSLDEVGTQGPRGWAWNREMLDTAVDAAGIDDEGSAALDGEPLDIDALVALDPSFTYDNVARRITRSRLWNVIVAMRAMTHENNLDLTWTHRGDPATWIASLAEDTGETSTLFDAWGHPFVMRRTTRTSFLPAVPGWEVASAGPDGVIDTRDDVFDPFARILPATSLYAEAVGENALVARLSGVAMGRAFVFTLDAHLGGDAEYQDFGSSTEDVSAHAWDDLPAPRSIDGEAHIDEASALSVQLVPSEAWQPRIASAERTWTAIAFASTEQGALTTQLTRLEIGARVVFASQLPIVLRVGDRLEVPFVATTLREGANVGLSIDVEGAALHAQLTNPASAEGVMQGRIALTAQQAGSATLIVRSDDGTFSHTHRIRVLPQGIPLIARTGHAGFTVDLDLPSQRAGQGAQPAGRTLSQTLIVATPRTLHHAHLLDEQESANAAILAWTGALQGDMDETLLPQATGVLNAPDALTVACALVATATREELVTQTNALRTALGTSARGGDVRARASTLLALASLPTNADTNDVVANTIRASRLDGWRAVHVSRADPNAMAMMAAALLTLSPEDETGRILYESSLSASQVVPAGLDAHVDTWIATLARALAARQLGLAVDADRFADQAAQDIALLDRAGARGAFWLHAAAAYGAFGLHPEAASTPATLTIGSEARTFSLDAPTTLRIEGTPHLHVVASEAVISILTQRVLRVLEPSNALPIRVAFEGTLGGASANTRSVFDFVITSTSDAALGPTVLELQIPANFVVDASAREAITRVAGAFAGPDMGNVIRLHLPGLAARSSVRIPMALRRVATGSAEGLGVIAYEATAPDIRFVSPNRIVQDDASLGGAP